MAKFKQTWMKVSDNKKWYWGVQEPLKGEPLVAPANLQITDPPYLAGEGWRIRIRHGSFHFGRIKGGWAEAIRDVDPHLVGKDEVFNPPADSLSGPVRERLTEGGWVEESDVAWSED